MPVVDQSVPSAEWVLSPEGEEAARRLARSLDAPAPVSIHSSAETKAVQTARLLAEGCGVQAEIETDLHEVGGRSWADTAAAYQEMAGRYLRGEAVEGWEQRASAQRRIVAEVRRLAEPGGDAVVVSHGLVLVLLLAWLRGVDAGTLVSHWRAIRFPDLCIVDWEARQILRPFGQPQ